MEDKYYFELHYKDNLKAVIFNHFKYKKNRFEQRDGTDVNRDDVKNCFTGFGFEVHVENDCTLKQIKNKLTSLSNDTNLKCLAVVILTHGDENGKLQAYDRSYKKNMLFRIFKDKLNHIPKLFFIQACRGNLIDEGKPLPVDVKYKVTDTVYVPNMLCHYATCERYRSIRDYKTGSKFVEILCTSIRYHGYFLDLVSVLTIVNFLTVEYYKSEKWKQMPQITNTMKKQILFKPVLLMIPYHSDSQKWNLY